MGLLKQDRRLPHGHVNCIAVIIGNEIYEYRCSSYLGIIESFLRHMCSFPSASGVGTESFVFCMTKSQLDLSLLTLNAAASSKRWNRSTGRLVLVSQRKLLNSPKSISLNHVLSDFTEERNAVSTTCDICYSIIPKQDREPLNGNKIHETTLNLRDG